MNNNGERTFIDELRFNLSWPAGVWIICLIVTMINLFVAGSNVPWISPICWVYTSLGVVWWIVTLFWN
jgi:hypothetical protein